MTIKLISVINEYSDDSSYSVYLNNIYTNRKSLLDDEIKKSDYEESCPNDNV